MYGSIAEWCLDWSTGPYASASLEIDPQGPAAGKRRVIRGRRSSASRYSENPRWRAEYTGLRILCELVDATHSQE
jgi:hypothetical protein